MRCRVHGFKIVGVARVTTDAQDRDMGGPRLRSELTIADLERVEVPSVDRGQWRMPSDAEQFAALRRMNEKNRRAFGGDDADLERVADTEQARLRHMNQRNRDFWNGGPKN